MILIPALIVVTITSLMITGLAHEHINQQTIWKNHQQGWNITHDLEQELIYFLNRAQTANSSVILIAEKFTPTPQQADNHSGTKLQQLILRDRNNPNYTLYILLERRVENFEVLPANTKIIAWHFGA